MTRVLAWAGRDWLLVSLVYKINCDTSTYGASVKFFRVMGTKNEFNF